MIHTKKLLHFNSAPVFIKHSCDNIDMIDNHYIHYHIDKKTYEVQKKTAIQKEIKGHEYTKVFDISHDSLHAYPKNSTKSLILIKNDNGLKVVANKKLAESTAIVKFSNNSKMLLVGSENGDLWLLDVALDKIIYTLNPRSDEISSIIFSEDDKLVAIASYDKKIEVYNTTNWHLDCTFEQESVSEDMVFSQDNQNLYAVQRDGDILAFDLKRKELFYNNNLGQHWLSTIKTYKSDNYAMIGARDNIFMIVDLKSGKVIKKILLKNQGLNSADFSEQALLMAFADGSILVCDMLKNRDETTVALKMEDYQKAKQLIDANILLYLDGSIDELHKSGERVLQKIITLIELGKIDEAVTEAEPFIDNEAFSEQFTAYMSQRSEIAQFVEAVDTKNFTTAYVLAEKYLHIRELKKYKQLEEFWHKCFNNAKNTIAKNPNDSASKIRAKGMLQSFLSVSSKQKSIKNLLENSIVFFQADSFVREKKFIQFFKLCEKHEFLEETKIYNKVISITQLLLANVNKAVQQKDYKNAVLTARRLLSFAPVKEEASKHIKEIRVIEKFNTATQEKNLFSTFSLVHENDFLENLLEYKSIMKNFDKTNEYAKEHAVSGDIQKTFNTMDEYMSIDYLKDHIAFTIKLAYLNAIPSVSQKESINWKKTFVNYIELYGKDQELKNIAIENGVLDIFESIHEDENYKGYKDKDFKENVVALV
jgi:WD40 repeat protein